MSYWNYKLNILIATIFIFSGALTASAESPKNELGTAKNMSTLTWAEVLEQNPDPKIVTNADLFSRIIETNLPWRVKDKQTGIEMLLVPPGEFMMGANSEDIEALWVEKPTHKIKISRAYYLGKTEVTQEQWVRIMEDNPSKFRSKTESSFRSPKVDLGKNNQQHEDFEFNYNLACILHATGQIEQAISAYQNAIQSDPLQPEPYKQLIDLLTVLGQIDQAEACNQQFIKFIPPEENTAELKKLAQAQAEKGIADSAAKVQYQLDQLPIDTVTWEDTQRFCRNTGLRLPTEAEWEYACRAGTTAPRTGDLDQAAWFVRNSKGHTHQVATKEPNALGFHDMIGNVFEWCSDWFSETHYKDAMYTRVNPSGSDSGEHRVLRGGSWYSLTTLCRTSDRLMDGAPTNSIHDHGFRVARSITK